LVTAAAEEQIRKETFWDEILENKQIKKLKSFYKNLPETNFHNNTMAS